MRKRKNTSIRQQYIIVPEGSKFIFFDDEVWGFEGFTKDWLEQFFDTHKKLMIQANRDDLNSRQESALKTAIAKALIHDNDFLLTLGWWGTGGANIKLFLDKLEHEKWMDQHPSNEYWRTALRRFEEVSDFLLNDRDSRFAAQNITQIQNLEFRANQLEPLLEELKASGQDTFPFRIKTEWEVEDGFASSKTQESVFPLLLEDINKIQGLKLNEIDRTRLHADYWDTLLFHMSQYYTNPISFALIHSIFTFENLDVDNDYHSDGRSWTYETIKGELPFENTRFEYYWDDMDGDRTLRIFSGDVLIFDEEQLGTVYIAPGMHAPFYKNGLMTEQEREDIQRGSNLRSAIFKAMDAYSEMDPVMLNYHYGRFFSDAPLLFEEYVNEYKALTVQDQSPKRNPQFKKANKRHLGSMLAALGLGYALAKGRK